MAVNISTTPLNRPNGDYTPITTVNYPMYSSWTLALTDIYDDFHYDVDLEDYNGTINTFQVIATDDDLFGNLSVNNFVDAIINVDINSKIEDIEITPNHVNAYELTIKPYNNSTFITADYLTTDTFCLMKGYKQDIELFDNDYLLINHKTKKLTTDSYFTNKSLYGIFNPASTNYDIDFDNIFFVLDKADGSSIEFKIEHSITKVTLGYTTLVNTDNMILELPVGPKNIMLKDRYVTKITTSGGTVTTPNANQTISIEAGDTYTYRTQLARTIVSDEYTIVVEDCRNRYKPTTIIYNNDLYAFNSFVCYDKKTEIISNKQLTYLSDTHERVGTSYVKTPADQDMNIYKDNVVENIMLTTGWLNENEIIELEQLWVATKIRIQDGDDLIPVVFSEVKKVIYNEKDRGLKQYTISLINANKKYFI